MNSKNKTFVITAVVTAVVVLIGFFVLMPILGPRFLHPMMMERMHGGGSGVSASDLNTDTTRMTNNGAFIVSFKSELDPIAIGSMHSWILHVETADGPLCVYNRETIVANNLVSRAQEKRDDRGRKQQVRNRGGRQSQASPTYSRI